MEEGIIVDLLLLAEARGFLECLQQNHTAIGRSSFSEVLASLADMANRQYVLVLCRLYEQPRARKGVSVHGLLDLLSRKATTMPLADPAKIRRLIFISEGKIDRTVFALQAPQLLSRLVRTCGTRLPTPQRAKTDRLSAALASLRTLRNKALAHGDLYPLEKIGTVTWRECDKLVSLVTDLVDSVQQAYFGTSTKPKLHAARESAETELMRLLRAAGVLDQQDL